jgi:hypothetical protein
MNSDHACIFLSPNQNTCDILTLNFSGNSLKIKYQLTEIIISTWPSSNPLCYNLFSVNILDDSYPMYGMMSSTMLSR